MGDSKAVQSSGMRLDFTTLSSALCISLEALCCRVIFLKQADKWVSQGTGRLQLSHRDKPAGVREPLAPCGTSERFH